MCRIIQIHSLSEYITKLEDLKKERQAELENRIKDDEIFLPINEFLYRGQPDTSFEILPSIGRQDTYSNLINEKKSNRKRKNNKCI